MYVGILKIVDEDGLRFAAKACSKPESYLSTVRKNSMEAEFVFLFNYPNWASYKISRFFLRLCQADLAYYCKQSPKQVKTWFDKMAGLQVPVLTEIYIDEEKKKEVNRSPYPKRLEF